MTTLLTRRAALPFAALLLAGCGHYGPAATREGMARLQPVLLPEDGALEYATMGHWLNVRLNPTIGQALLLGVRNDLESGIVVVTERSLIAALWAGEPRGYQVSFRIPYREIIAIGPFGSIGIYIETNVPRHTPLGGPTRTGLYRVSGVTPRVMETVRLRAPQAGTSPQ